MQNQDAKEIIERFKAGAATPQDTVLLEDWLLNYNADESSSLTDLDLEKSQGRVLAMLEKRIVVKKSIRLWSPIGVAAAVIITVLLAGLFFYSPNDKVSSSQSLVRDTEINPAGSGATLTLSNGKKIKLSASGIGQMATESGVKITKTSDEQIIYTTGDKDADPTMVNTLATARGETYRVVLPDGSAVWLNAESSITYPISFRGAKARTIKLVGEGYFEIKKDKAHPFIVKSGGQQVEVLGTHFNIRAYDHLNIKTTLLEGSVRLSTYVRNDLVAQSMLKPGEQAVVKGNSISIAAADIGQAVAWKNGNFSFNGEGIQSIMKELERWYNIEVVYEGTPTQELYYADLSRYKNIAEVLSLLEDAKGVHFKIQGRRVIVTK